MISSITGHTTTESAGAQRRAEGKTEYKQAQAQGYAEGTSCVHASAIVVDRWPAHELAGVDMCSIDADTLSDRLAGNLKDTAGSVGRASETTQAKGALPHRPPLDAEQRRQGPGEEGRGPADGQFLIALRVYSDIASRSSYCTGGSE